MLTVPRFRTKWGSRAFAVAAEDFFYSIRLSPPIPRRFGAQLVTYALTLDIELVSIWILRL